MPNAAGSGLFPPSVARAWPEIAFRLRRARQCALFLDFDGTLVSFKPRPADVRLPSRTECILGRLARNPGILLAIVSCRRIKDLQTLINITGIRHFGLHGGEQQGKKTEVGKIARRFLAIAKREARKHLAALTGIGVDDKDLSFAVHYRGASHATVRAATEILLQLLAPLRHSLHLLHGAKVWEGLPKDIRGKGAVVTALRQRMPSAIPAIYVGDDDCDESAFAALACQITVRAGRKCGTHARFYVRNPSEVHAFLIRLENELLTKDLHDHDH
ncbi:MAG TPA: trehalose-phosphatase [Candidatus Dormibacteraeota bacterium]|nr:trehalose-phosphatase [Candidatus Dormibacteraeota bacterium]